MSKGTRRTLVAGLIASVSLLMMFQNCSQVSFTEAAPSASLEGLDTPVAAEYSEMKVGARDIPPLKLFFVVDNSYTMIQNNLRLAESFGRMFDASNTESLANFDSTAYLINTAQRSPAWSTSASSDLVSIGNLQLNPSAIADLPMSQLSTLRSATKNSGQVAGDNLGFFLSRTATTATFLPAMVKGLGNDGTGKILAVDGVHKAKSDSVAAFSSEFQSRLAVLNSSRIPTTAAGTQVYGASILDQESGLCAVARIMRNNKGLITNGDNVAFVLVSDEDDADSSGESCIQSYDYQTSADDLIKGTCEERSTTVSYTVPGNGASSCKISYNTQYKYAYTWNETVKKTTIVYRKVTSVGTYSSPQTKIVYSVSAPTYKKISTQLSYQLKNCVPVYADGVRVGENCSYSNESKTVDGDKTGSCQASVLGANSAAVVGDLNHPFSCAKQESSVSSCAGGDANCVTTPAYSATSTVVAGTITQANCAAAAATRISGAITDGSQPLTCSVATPQTGSGECPSNLIAAGCTATGKTYGSGTVTIDGDFTATCDTKAAAQSNAAVDASHPATCTVADVNVSRTANGALTFNSGLDSGNTVAVGDCGSITGQVYTTVKTSYPTAVSGGTCKITGYNAASVSQAVATSGCAQQATDLCAASANTKRACAGAVIAGASTTANFTLPTISREIKCSDTCSSISNQLCVGNTDPMITIENFLKLTYGSGVTCNAVVGKTTVSTFQDKKQSDAASLCVGTAAKPQYLVTNGAAYRLNELVVDHVAGSDKGSDGKYHPKKDLVAYINQRSHDLLGGQPSVSVFVRTAGDGLTVGSVGTEYQRLAMTSGGKTEKISASDYSPALSSLGQVIKAKLERSFQILAMKPHQTVHNVWLRKPGGSFVLLEAKDWKASGNTVILESALAIDLQDDLKFEYY